MLLGLTLHLHQCYQCNMALRREGKITIMMRFNKDQSNEWEWRAIRVTWNQNLHLQTIHSKPSPGFCIPILKIRYYWMVNILFLQMTKWCQQCNIYHDITSIGKRNGQKGINRSETDQESRSRIFKRLLTCSNIECTIKWTITCSERKCAATEFKE